MLEVEGWRDSYFTFILRGSGSSLDCSLDRSRGLDPQAPHQFLLRVSPLAKGFLPGTFAL